MKRCSTEPEPSKRVKHSNRKNLLTLPLDIQSVIFSFLERKDIINLSTLSKRHRRELCSFAFKRIKCKWKDLIDDKIILAKYSEYVSQLRITDYSSYGEWQLDFNEFLRLLPNLRHLLLNSNNLSNWLKYRSNNLIKELSLYLEDTPISQFRTKTSRSPRIFSLSHLWNFLSLKKIYLSKYHFNWEMENVSDLISLEELTIDNCTWEYPFKLTNFDPRGTVRVLNITYNKYNSFLLSERFNQFMVDEDDIFKSLKLLSISLLDYYVEGNYLCEKLLSSKLFLKFMNNKKFPYLVNFKLHGGTLNLENLKFTLMSIDENINTLELLDLKIICQRNQKLYDEIEKLCHSKFPRMHLKLDIPHNPII
ncbi:uncharacterized protein PRCAT00005637001 [Priceomyces carsonii]|uniref:uncharacterized protein n=1 Tax=Priceomyces carsonii TaxID=28549 RepID=UPI002ED8FC32|nr:unnamed protein product [Priceomyces carsonii]